MINISLVIFLCVFSLLVIPCKVNICINICCKEFFKKVVKQNKLKNNITVKALGIIPIYNKKLFNENANKNKKKESKFGKNLKSRETAFMLLDKSYLDKFVLSLGINVEDYIANAYINASVNTLLCLYININQDKFNLKKLYYQTYVSDELLKLNFETNIKIKLIDFLIILFKSNKKQKEKVQNQSKNAS